MTKHIRESFVSQFSKDVRGHQIPLDERVYFNLEEKVETCQHKEYCIRPKFNMKCVFGKTDCNIKYQYDLHGEGYNLLGI